MDRWTSTAGRTLRLALRRTGSRQYPEETGSRISGCTSRLQPISIGRGHCPTSSRFSDLDSQSSSVWLFRSKPSQSSVSADLTLASDFSLCFRCKLGSAECRIDRWRPPRQSGHGDLFPTAQKEHDAINSHQDKRVPESLLFSKSKNLG